VYLRGKATWRLDSLCCASGCGVHARGSANRPSSSAGQAPAAAKPDARSEVERVVADVGRSLGSSRSAATSGSADANDVAASFTWARAEAWDRVLLDASSGAETSNSASKLPFWRLTAEAVSAREGSLGGGCAIPPAEAGLHAHHHPWDASRRRATEVERRRKTRSGNATTPPMGFGSFRRLSSGDRHAGLPRRHHPLSGFLTLSAV
jgi:hypothetical protein